MGMWLQLTNKVVFRNIYQCRNSPIKFPKISANFAMILLAGLLWTAIVLSVRIASPSFPIIFLNAAFAGNQLKTIKLMPNNSKVWKRYPIYLKILMLASTKWEQTTYSKTRLQVDTVSIWRRNFPGIRRQSTSYSTIIHLSTPISVAEFE